MQTRPSDLNIEVRPWDRMAAGVLTALLLIVAISAAGYGLIVLAAAAKEILVSVIAAVASLLAAVFAYVFQRMKDLELAAIQRRRELEIAERRVKQENYSRILERLAPYIRDPKDADSLTTAYLQTWVTGSVAVVQGTRQFLEQRSYKTLDELLHAMRDDLSLEEWGAGVAIRDESTKNLFPAPTPKGGLQK